MAILARRLLTAVPLVAVLTLAPVAGCGDDDDDAASPTQGGAAATTIGGGAATTGATSDGTAPGSTSGAAQSSPECPSAEAVTAAVGTDMVVDEDAGITASGFCPYTDSTGDVVVSLTFTNLDVTQDPGVTDTEHVDGLGENAIWSQGAGELAVWTGDRGLLVDILLFGQKSTDLDARSVAVKLAQAALDAA